MPIYKTNEKNNNGLLKYKVRYNYTDETGKAHSLTRIAYGLAEAKELEYQLSRSVTETAPSKYTINDLYDEFVKSNQVELRGTTLRVYETYYNNYIRNIIGNVVLTKINGKILNSWKNAVNAMDIQLTTKRSAYGKLKTLFNFAVRLDYIAKNPLEKIPNFKDSNYQKKGIDFYTPEEFSKYIAVARHKAASTNYFDYYIFFLIAYYTGLRKGEIHALRWRNIKGNTISVEKSITQKLKGDDVETAPKNKSSIRTIQLPQVLLNELKEHRARQQNVIPGWTEDGFICGYSRSLRDTSIENENKEYSTAAGLKHIRIHDFRHSHASLLINRNISPLEVAHRLGHSTVDQTLKTYSHLFPKESEKAVRVLDSVHESYTNNMD